MSDITLQSFRDITRKSSENSMNRIFIHGGNLKSVGLWGRFIFYLRHGRKREDHNLQVMTKLILVLDNELGQGAGNIAQNQLRDRFNRKTKLRLHDVRQILNKVDAQARAAPSQISGELTDSTQLMREKVRTKLNFFYPLKKSNATQSAESKDLMQKYDLADEEVVSIHCYTTSEQGLGYHAMNDALRHTETATEFQSKEVFPFIHQTHQGLEKLPNYEGLVYRTTQNMQAGSKLLENYKVGKRVIETGFTSTTLNDNPIRDGKSAFFKIHSKHGKYIAPFSHNPGEREILFKPGTEFEVNSVEEPIVGEVIITMSEVSFTEKNIPN